MKVYSVDPEHRHAVLARSILSIFCNKLKVTVEELELAEGQADRLFTINDVVDLEEEVEAEICRYEAKNDLVVAAPEPEPEDKETDTDA